MKISKEQKDKNRQALLASAVKVISADGFKNATMQKIAREAKLSDAVIYKYFATKEALLFSYFAWKFDQTLECLVKNPDFEDYDLADQLQALLEQHLELLAADRDFVKVAFQLTHQTVLSGAFTELGPHRDKYIQFITKLLQAAVDSGEVPEPPYLPLIADLIWDFHIAVVYHWLKDDSDDFTRTTNLIDKSLSLFIAVLTHDILGKVADLGYFLIREHLLRHLALTDPIPSRTRKKKSGLFS